MKKMIVCLCAYLIVALSYKVVSADEGVSLVNETRVESYISNLYKQIDFSKYAPLSYEVFDKAFHGYLNLLNSGKISREKGIISICDFSMPSSENRLWIIDLIKRKVLFNTYVAHGQGSGDDMATSFSNSMNSHKSSLGFYVTGDIYDGEHGTSLRLQGMDEGFNDAAYDRGIVVHGADYVCNKFVTNNQRLGRSWGCPAVPAKLSGRIIDAIKDSTCLFIYSPESRYLESSYWLNKKITTLPADETYAGLLPAEITKPRKRVIQYIHNGKVDSVKTVDLVE
jgi:hypothetical protein